MKQLIVSLLLATFLVLFGCGPIISREVMLGSSAPPKSMSLAYLAPMPGNSPDMDARIQQELKAHGVSIKPMPVDVKNLQDADLVVKYIDVWKWDIVMYLGCLNIYFFDAKSMDLIVTGSWYTSPRGHWFNDSSKVIRELLDDMFSKISISAPINR